MTLTAQSYSPSSVGNIYFLKLHEEAGEAGPVLLCCVCILYTGDYVLYSSETNLKVKQAISVTSEMENNLQLLSAFNGELGYKFSTQIFISRSLIK